MSTTTSANQDADKNQPPKALLKVVNPIMRGILRSPLHGIISGRLMLLHITGRKTGKHYTIPVGYAQAGSALYSSTDARWSSNLRGGAAIEVGFKGRRRPAEATVISDTDDLVTAYREIFIASPGYARALTRTTGVTYGPHGEVKRDDVERSRDAGHIVVRTTFSDAV